MLTELESHWPFYENRLTPEGTGILQNFFSSHDVLLLGPSGAGKTTLTEHLQRSICVRYISLGNITRSEMEFCGNQDLVDLLRQGGVWPFEKIVQLLKPYMELPLSYVLDGIPKHEHEALWLSNHIRRRPWPMVAIELCLPMNIAEGRKLNSLERDRRPETIDQIKERVEIYKSKKGALMEILNKSLEGIIELDTDKLTPNNAINQLTEKIIANRNLYG